MWCTSCPKIEAGAVDPATATVGFYFASRRCALAVRRNFIVAYNRRSPKGGEMRAEDFLDVNFRVDAEAEERAFKEIGVSKDLAWFIRHSIVYGASSMPRGSPPPDAVRVLCDLDAVDAPAHVKRNFVDLAACIIKASL